MRSAVFQRVGNAPGWSHFCADESRSGGALVDMHIHDADFVRWCFGDPRRVRSVGTTRHVLTHYEFADGPELIIAEGGWIEAAGFPFNMRYRVEFERAALEFEMSRDKSLMISEHGESRPIVLPAHNGYDVEVRELLATIAGGERVLRATVAEAERVAVLLEAERESLRTGRAVSQPFSP